MVAQRGQMAGRCGRDLARNAAKPLLDELLEGPARAVSRQHGQIVQMQVAVAVGVGDLLVVDLRQPVVGRDRARVAQDQAAHRVGDGRIFLDAPVRDLDIAVHQLLIVEDRGFHIADLLPLLAVQNIGLGHVRIAGLHQYLLDAVLYILHCNQRVLDFRLEIRRHLERQQVDDAGMKLPSLGFKRLGDRHTDLGEIEIHPLPVSLHHLIHLIALL